MQTFKNKIKFYLLSSMLQRRSKWKQNALKREQGRQTMAPVSLGLNTLTTVIAY